MGISALRAILLAQLGNMEPPTNWPRGNFFILWRGGKKQKRSWQGAPETIQHYSNTKCPELEWVLDWNPWPGMCQWGLWSWSIDQGCAVEGLGLKLMTRHVSVRALVLNLWPGMCHWGFWHETYDQACQWGFSGPKFMTRYVSMGALFLHLWPLKCQWGLWPETMTRHMSVRALVLNQWPGMCQWGFLVLRTEN